MIAQEEVAVDAAALLIEYDRAWWEFFDFALEGDLRIQRGQQWQSLAERNAHRDKRRALFEAYLAAMRAALEAGVDPHERDYRWNDRLDGWRRRPNPNPPPSEIWERTAPPVDRLP